MSPSVVPSASRLEFSSRVIWWPAMEMSPAASVSDPVDTLAPDSMVMVSATTVRSRPLRDVVPLKSTEPGLLSFVFTRPELTVRSKLTVPRSLITTLSPLPR